MNVIIIICKAVDWFGKILQWLIFGRIILSWFPINRNSTLMQLLYTLTEPVLGPIRSIIRKSPLGGPGMMLDFSPILAYFLIQIASSAIIYGLLTLA